MVITYFGVGFLKLQLGDTVIAVNPFGKGSKEKTVRFGANIALVASNAPDYNGVENLQYGEKKPFVISGPGEYEVGGISINGFPSGKGEVLSYENTIYTLTLDGIRMCLLGALHTGELSSETYEGIGEVDLVFVPIAGDTVLGPADAEKLAVSLGAKMIIPTHHSGKGDKQLQQFLKESGSESVEYLDKLTLKRKDLDGLEGAVRVLVAGGA